MKRGKKERDRAKREKERARLQNEGRHAWGPKERRKACRSVPSQRHHSGDATRNRESDRQRERNEREARERERERKRERKRERAREKERGGSWFVGRGIDFHTVRMGSSKNHWSARLCRDRLGLRKGAGVDLSIFPGNLKG